MSRITDSERGARIALEQAIGAAMQPDLLDDSLPPQFWDAIADAARLQLDDCYSMREALLLDAWAAGDKFKESECLSDRMQWQQLMQAYGKPTTIEVSNG